MVIADLLSMMTHGKNYDDVRMHRGAITPSFLREHDEEFK